MDNSENQVKEEAVQASLDVEDAGEKKEEMKDIPKTPVEASDGEKEKVPADVQTEETSDSEGSVKQPKQAQEMSPDSVSSSPPPSMPHTELAGVVDRFVAYAIDTFLLCFAAWFISQFNEPFFMKMGVFGRLVGLTLMVLYFGILQGPYNKGQSIGKWLMKIRIVGSDGKPLSYKSSFLRAFILSGALLINNAHFPDMGLFMNLSVLGLMIILFALNLGIWFFFFLNTKNRQGIHDIITGSYVVKVTSRGPVHLPKTSHVLYYVYGGICIIGFLASILFLALPILQSGFVKKQKNSVPQSYSGKVRECVMQVPGVEDIKINSRSYQRIAKSSNSQLKDNFSIYEIDVSLKDKDSANEQLAKKIYKKLASKDLLRDFDMFSIGFYQSLDLGIYSYYIADQFAVSRSEETGEIVFNRRESYSVQFGFFTSSNRAMPLMAPK